MQLASLGRAALPALVSLSVLAPSASVASQGIATFGAGCGARGTLLDGHGSPTPQNRVELRVTRAAPSAPHALLVGLSDKTWSGGPLPWSVPAGFGFAPGCTLLVADDLAVPIAVGADGDGREVLPVPAAALPGAIYFQAIGLPSGEPRYATRGLAVTVGLAPPTAVRGAVRLSATGAPVADARITLFAPGLTSFFEARSDAGGSFGLTGVPPGRYRIGAASRTHQYDEDEIDVGPAGARRDFALERETHQGEWRVIGDTLPHTLDATDIAVLLPDGRIFYCHDTEDPIVFDPLAGTKWAPPGSGTGQGCTNCTLLEDGRVIEVGGQEGSDPGNFRLATRWVKTWSATAGWARLPDLLNPTGRWYPGLARLADGDLLIMGGGTRPNATRIDTCEIFDRATETWRYTGRMGQAVEFPPAALLYDGRVLRTWGSPELYDPAAGTWTPTGAFTAPNRGWPGHSDHSMLVLSDRRALVVGINTRSAGPGAPMAEAYDASVGTWSALASPALVRSQAEVIYLPDGNVLVAGGDVQDQPAPVAQLYGIVKWTDLYDPRRDTWRRVADMLQFREYHAVTILLPDGRVTTTGGTKIKFKNVPLSADIEAYSPPYLFRGVRPRIGNLSNKNPRRGETLAFDVSPATRLTSVVVMGTGAHTHWVEGGVPRRLELPVQQNGSRATVGLPSDRNVLPVGHYLLFAMVDDIPSVAAVIHVDR